MKNTNKLRLISVLSATSIMLSNLPFITANAVESTYSANTVSFLEKQDYSINVVKIKEWDNNYQGEIIIANTGSSPIYNWAIEMDFEGDFDKVWGAELNDCDKGKAILSCATWNNYIAPGASICIGFIASAADNVAVPKNIFLISKSDFYSEKAVSDTTDNCIFTDALTINGMPYYGNLDILPELNDGIIATLSADTEVKDDLNLNTADYNNDAPFISNSSIFVDANNTVISDTVIAYEDITLNGNTIKSGENTVIYSKNGDINISADSFSFNGIIYAPNGNINIKVNHLDFSGRLIGKSVTADYTDGGMKSDDASDKFFETCGSISANLITDISELYGTDYDINFTELARRAALSKCEDADSLELSNAITLYDVNDVASAYAFNFTSEGKDGYVIVGNHSKAHLLDCISTEDLIDTDVDKIYYFGNGELYYDNKETFSTLKDVVIPADEFNEYKSYRKSCQLNVSYDMLENIEEQNQVIINQLNNNLDEFGKLMKHYSGTDSDAYGYGGIKNPKSYLEDRYGKTMNLSNSGRTLSVNSSTMSSVSGKNENNCSLVAIAKVLKYWRDYRGKSNIPNSINTIYNDVERFAKNYGYNKNDGTDFWDIYDICNDVISNYGYQPYCDGIYVWSFEDEVKSHIDSNEPVIMNIARGYYGNHSVTVVGYCIYKKGSKEYPMVRVSDGWQGSYRYIDYNDFAHNLISSGFGSFNTVYIG